MSELSARPDHWTDALPQSWQHSINTSPLLNALGRALSRPSPDLTRGIEDQYGSVSDRNWLLEQAAGGPPKMNPLAADMLDKGGLLAGFLTRAPRPQPQWVDAYHGAVGNKPYSRFNPGYEGASFHAADPALANEFATISGVNKFPMVYKNKINVDGFQRVDWPKVTGNDWYTTENMIRLLDQARYQKIPGLVIENMTEPLGGPATKSPQYAVLDPSRIRSFTAQFNPAKSHLPDLMASRLWPAAIPAGVYGATLADQPQQF